MRTFLKLLAAVAPAFGHTIFTNLWVNGVSQGALNGIRYPTYDGPVTDVTSASIICNGDPNPLTTPYSQTIINVPAGATIMHEWHHTLTSTMATDSQDPIDPSHLGPVMVYLAKVPSALTTTVTGLQWFKIAEWGLENGVWGTTQLWTDLGKFPATIPACIEPGNYFLRAEIIALHAASTYPGAQFYMECAQINVTGGGTAQPATVSFPGAYSGTDPGITIDIYYPPVTNYTVPGPAVFTCGGASSPAPSTSAKASTVASTTAAKTTSTAAAPTTSTAAGTVAQYGQCGGTGWTGATACVAPFTCTVSSAYYSQCL